MTTLTLEAIQADAWNAVNLQLPADRDSQLLEAALKASALCVEEAHGKMQAARAGTLIPEGWHPGPESPDAHEFYEQDWLNALNRFEALQELVAG